MQKDIAYFRRFWAKEPRHSETIFAKKRYTSIVARVLGPILDPKKTDLEKNKTAMI